jgi:hypothetical protein
MNLSQTLKNIFNKHFYYLLGGLVVIEVASYFGYLFPVWGDLSFWLVTGLILVFSLKNIRYGICAAFLELLIGSKGYLFSTAIAGTEISIRIAIWLILLAIWIVYFFSSFFKKTPDKKSIFLKKETYRQNYLYYFFGLFFFIAVGLAIGLARNNFSDVFLDFNGWLFFALLFPCLEAVSNKNFSGENLSISFGRIFAVGIFWLFLKTIFLLFLFSHVFSNSSWMQEFLNYKIYRWVRESGVGEITMMPFGFVRIFFQSHIFALFAFFAILTATVKFSKEILTAKKTLIFLTLAQTAVISLIMISYSRSFWVGLAAGLLFSAFIFLKKYGWKKSFIAAGLTIVSTALALGLIATVIKFPFPKPGVNFNIAEALTDRAKKVNNEAAASSRYALLPELWKEIRENFIFGGGFGQTVSYRTSDPKILENNPDGYYTTYAFEWGWLDVWLKIGLFGGLFYLLFFLKLFKNSLRQNDLRGDVFALSLVVLVVVNFFTPYVNHPLGIGTFLFVAIALFHRGKHTLAF